MAALSPSTVERNGGWRVAVTGLTVPSGRYTFHVGPLGTAADTAAYAGAYGNVNSVAVAAGAASFAAPPLAAGTYNVFLTAIAGGGGSGSELIASSLIYVHKNFQSGTYRIRSAFPTWYRLGPSRVDEEPPQGW